MPAAPATPLIRRAAGRAFRAAAATLLAGCTIPILAWAADAPEAREAGPLIQREIRYDLPSAGPLTLVWGIDGWQPVAEALRPAHTVLHGTLMHTPMTWQDGRHTVTVTVPEGARLDHGVTVTALRDGTPIRLIWVDHGELAARTAPEGVVEWVETPAVTAALHRTIPLADWARAAAWFMQWLLVLVALAWGARAVPMERRPVACAAVLAITLLGLWLRLQAAWSVSRLLAPPLQLIGDEGRYVWLAEEVLRGHGFPWPAAMPVYPLFLAACFALFGQTYGPVLAVQSVLGALLIPLTYRLARHLMPRWGAWLAAGLVAVLPPLVGHSARLYTEVVYTPLLTLAVLAWLWAMKHPAAARWALAGAAMGLATLCRPTTAMFPLLAVALLPKTWTLTRRMRAWLAYAAAAALLLAPWSAYNSLRHRQWIPLGSSLGTLWQGSPEMYHLMRERRNALNWIWTTVFNPKVEGGLAVDTMEGDRESRARAMRSIRAEPLTYAWYCAQKTAYFWVGHPGESSDWPFSLRTLQGYYAPRLAVKTMGSRLLLLLAAGLAIIRLRRRWREFAILFAVAGYLTLMHALLLPLARHSEPLYPLLAVLIGAACAAPRRQHPTH